MSTVYVVTGDGSGTALTKPSAVFADIADVRRFTGKESGIYGGDYETWGLYRVFKGVPLNPPVPERRAAGRKKTARRRRTTRKH